MSYYFPISEPMVGSVIPGLKQRIHVYKIVTWPGDFSNALTRRRAPVDPVIKFPDMAEKHGQKHPMMQQLSALLKSRGPEMREGYTPFVGSRNWRNA